MIFDEKFSRVVVISIDSPEGKTRADRALAELKKKGLSDKAEVFRAIDAKLCPPPDWWVANPGAWGCMQSHYRIVQDALMDDLESVLIIEDDCIWQNDPAEMARQVIEQAPDDWGQIYFGGQHRSDKLPEWIAGRPAIVKPSSVHRTHCYAIHKRCMSQFLQHIVHAPDYIEEAKRPGGKKRHIDHQLEVAHKRGDWPVYCASFWLAGQGENTSSINGKTWETQWWHLPYHGSYLLLPIIVIDRDPTPGEMSCLHIGYHPKEDCPWIDAGYEKTKAEGDVKNMTSLIMLEAWKRQRLPAIPNDPEKLEILERLGRKLVRLSSDPDLEFLTDFPKSKLCDHPWLHPTQNTVIESAVIDNNWEPDLQILKRRYVHQVWLGDNEMPERINGYRATVEDHFQEREYKLWGEGEMEELAKKAVLPEVVLDQDFPVGMRSDVVRLEILRQYGGAYFDVDFEVLKHGLDHLLNHRGMFCYADEKSGRPSNAFLAADGPNHPFIEFYLRRIDQSLKRSTDLHETVRLTGPEKLAEALNLWVGDWSENDPVAHLGNRVGSAYSGGIIGLWKETMYPYHYEEGTFATFDPEKFPMALAAHHWEGSWVKK